MARKLVEQMSGPWNPEAFKDTYRADLMRTIQEKVRKKQWHSLPAETEERAERPKAQVIDLMDALKKSLKSRSSDESDKSAARAAPKAHRRA
jgi:DNA end-binding protein Ku